MRARRRCRSRGGAGRRPRRAPPTRWSRASNDEPPAQARFTATSGGGVGVRRVLVAVLVVLAACGGDSADDEITVFAAASLTDAFEEIADAFETANPDNEVTLSFGASSSLREQILEGAPADVFASANTS